jgi:hypothetical protein
MVTVSPLGLMLEFFEDVAQCADRIGLGGAVSLDLAGVTVVAAVLGVCAPLLGLEDVACLVEPGGDDRRADLLVSAQLHRWTCRGSALPDRSPGLILATVSIPTRSGGSA